MISKFVSGFHLGSFASPYSIELSSKETYASGPLSGNGNDSEEYRATWNNLEGSLTLQGQRIFKK